MQRHFLIYLVVLTIFFCTAVQIATTISPSINEYLFRHVANDELSGFGGYIQRSPPGLRVLLYGLLAFVSPIPIYPFLDKQIEGVYYFGLLIGLGGMIYLSCNVFVLIALVQQSRLLKVDGGTSPDVREVARVHFMRTMKGFIVLFICQLSFQGLGYNVRHKIQMIPLLILVGLYCIRFIRQRPGLSGLLETPGVVGSICVISALNILYLLGKVLTSSGQG